MDGLRGIAILSVLFYHSVDALVFNGVERPSALLTATLWLEPFRMPTLMFLSGMLLSRSLAKPTRIFLRGKARHIVWPYLVWSLISLAIAGRLDAPTLLAVIIRPPSELWYLWFLAAFYVFALFVPRRRSAWLAVAAAAAGGSVAFQLADGEVGPRLLFLLLFFALGHATAGFFTDTTAALRVVLLVFGLPLAVAAAAASADRETIRYAIGWTPAVFAGIACSIALAQSVAWRGPVARVLTVIGRNSLVFYVVHDSAIRVWARLTDSYDGMNPWLAAASNLAVAFGVSYAFFLAAQRFAVVDLLFVWPEQWTGARSAQDQHDDGGQDTPERQRERHAEATITEREGGATRPAEFGGGGQGDEYAELRRLRIPVQDERRGPEHKRHHPDGDEDGSGALRPEYQALHDDIARRRQ